MSIVVCADVMLMSGKKSLREKSRRTQTEIKKNKKKHFTIFGSPVPQEHLTENDGNNNSPTTPKEKQRRMKRNEMIVEKLLTCKDRS